MFERKAVSNKLIFVDQGIGKFELRLDSVIDNFPKLTYREAIKTYFYIDLPQNGKTSYSEFRDIRLVWRSPNQVRHDRRPDVLC